MKQTRLDPNLSRQMTRKQVFLAQMQRVVPWAAPVAPVALTAPYYPEDRNARPLFALETMLGVHFMQQWRGLSDTAMEEAFFDTPLYREFAQIEAHGRVTDESTVLRFRHRLETHKPANRIRVTFNHGQPPSRRARLASQSRHGGRGDIDCRTEFHKQNMSMTLRRHLS